MSDGTIKPNKISTGFPSSVSPPADATRRRDPRLDDVAKLYEKQFLREMVKAMRSTVSEGALQANMAERIYREQLDHEYIESWGDQGGVGLADLIYKELENRFYGGGNKGVARQRGPIAISDRDVLRVASRPILRPQADADINKKLSLNVELAPGSAGARLKMPWAGQVLSLPRLDNGQSAAIVGHDDGLRSTFVFQGWLDPQLKPGDRMQQGSQIGTLNPGINGFLWNLDRQPKETL